MLTTSLLQGVQSKRFSNIVNYLLRHLRFINKVPVICTRVTAAFLQESNHFHSSPVSSDTVPLLRCGAGFYNKTSGLIRKKQVWGNENDLNHEIERVEYWECIHLFFNIYDMKLKCIQDTTTLQKIQLMHVFFFFNQGKDLFFIASYANTCTGLISQS